MKSIELYELINCAWTLWRNEIITTEEHQKICNSIVLQTKEVLDETARNSKKSNETV